MPLRRVFFSLGSNLGDRRENLERAIEALEREQIPVLQQSSIYETEPQEVANQPWFLNMVVQSEAHYFPIQCLRIVQRIERELGRVRGGSVVRKGPRVIDIDILLFGNVVMESGSLTLPHPRMLERRFVLEPLKEIAPGLRHPVNKEPIDKYLSCITGQKVRKL